MGRDDPSADELAEFVTNRDQENKKGIDAFGGVDGLTSSLKTDAKNGIDEGSVEERKNKYGPNSFPENHPKGSSRFGSMP